MKQLFLIIAFLLGITGIKAQTNPFEELGYTPRFATLSNGQFNEFHDNDTIVQIGSVWLNTKSKQIVGFVEQDTLYSEATLQPDIVSRWISPDPLADHPNQVDKSPYAAMWNNPVYWTDPDGRCPWCIVWAVVEIGLAVYDAYETGATIIDPNASTGEKWAAAGGFALGAIMPGGGYGKGAKETVKAIDKVVDAGKVIDKANDVRKITKANWGKVNTYGGKKQTAIEHIKDGHFFDSRKGQSTSRFSESNSNITKVKELTNEAVTKGKHSGTKGNYSVTYTFDDVIGTTSDGKKTKTIQVYLDEVGNVLNSYPVATPKN